VAAEIAAFAAEIGPYGAINGLSQAVLRLTAPGIPDLYQGTDFWDLSLVDPDNRRPVDYAAREAALEAGETPARLLQQWHDGRVKQAIITRLLHLRAAHPALFTTGAYQPLRVEGERAEHVLAFARTHEDDAALVLVTRCPAGLALETMPLIHREQWGGTMIHVPRYFIGRHIKNVLGSEGGRACPAQLTVAEWLTELPVAVLEA
jgi:(1->4)-alpha-D-glucan 1-alpha-D-glucosylmutase